MTASAPPKRKTAPKNSSAPPKPSPPRMRGWTRKCSPPRKRRFRAVSGGIKCPLMKMWHSSGSTNKSGHFSSRSPRVAPTGISSVKRDGGAPVALVMSRTADDGADGMKGILSKNRAPQKAGRGELGLLGGRSSMRGGGTNSHFLSSRRSPILRRSAVRQVIRAQFNPDNASASRFGFPLFQKKQPIRRIVAESAWVQSFSADRPRCR